SSAGAKAAARLFLEACLTMHASKSERGKIIKPDVPAAQNNRRACSICIARVQSGADQSASRAG
ncbi:hypothetical protein ABTC18_19975, partial [Acinetobacter baumannii]